MKSKIITMLVAFLAIAENAVWGQTQVSISTAEDMWAFAERVNENTDNSVRWDVTLEADIDLGGESTPWTPIRQFRGTFDGGNHTISGLYIKDVEDFVGLFGEVESGGIKNLTLQGEIENCTGRVGGFCGQSETTLINCHNEVNITVNGFHTIQGYPGTMTVGGLSGNGSTFESCSNSGNITINIPESASNSIIGVGGIAGSGGTYATNCYNLGTITINGNNKEVGSITIGGAIGAINGKLENCYNTGDVIIQELSLTGNDPYAFIGGIVGMCEDAYVVAEGLIRYCYNTGNISIPTNFSSEELVMVGGVLGASIRGVTISNSYCLTQENIEAIGFGSNTVENVETKEENAFKDGTVAYELRMAGGNYGQDIHSNTPAQSPTLLCFTPDDAVYKLTLNYGEVDAEKETEEKFVNSKYLGLPELTTEEEGKRIGWFDNNGTEYISESEITEDITLTAKVIEQSEEPEQPGDEDDDQGDTGIHTPQRPIKYYNIYVDTICPGLNVEVSKDVVQEGHQVSAYLTIQAECDTTGMRFEYKRGLFGYWKDLKELEGVQPGEYIIKNIYTDIYIRALDATLPEEEPTGIEAIEGAKAYAKDGSIYVYTPSREEVMIIGMSGAIIKRAEQVGLQSYSVSRGIYIVRIGDKVFKLKN